MREDSTRNKGEGFDLHWHNGSTCHGAPSLEACVELAIKRGWVGKVLKNDDVYCDGTKVSCYSLIASGFDHWKKHGTFVAVVELTFRLL